MKIKTLLRILYCLASAVSSVSFGQTLFVPGGTAGIAPSGANVGIGAASSAARLDLVYDSGAIDGLRFQDTAAAGTAWKIGSGRGGAGRLVSTILRPIPSDWSSTGLAVSA